MHTALKIKLSKFYAYPDGSPSQLIWISGVILYMYMDGWMAGLGRLDRLYR